MFQLILSYLNILAIIVAVPGFLITVYVLFETPNRNIKLLKSDPYKLIVGDFRLWNLSMENYLDETGVIRLVFTKITIRRRLFRVPSFNAEYRDDALNRWNSSASGDVFVSGNRLFFVGQNDDPRDGRSDPTLLVFERSGKDPLDYSIGFLAGYQEPPVPYAGIFVLERAVNDRAELTPDEVRSVLGQTPYLDYRKYTARLADVVKKKFQR